MLINAVSLTYLALPARTRTSFPHRPEAAVPMRPRQQVPVARYPRSYTVESLIVLLPLAENSAEAITIGTKETCTEDRSQSVANGLDVVKHSGAQMLV